MPIYQYDCNGCSQQVEIFFRSVSRAIDPTCPSCGSKDLARVVSRIAPTRSTREAIDSVDIRQELGRLDGTDERSFSRWARQMGDRFDGELGTDFSELASKADAGLDPSERVDPTFALTSRLERAKERLAGSDDD